MIFGRCAFLALGVLGRFVDCECGGYWKGYSACAAEEISFPYGVPSLRTYRLVARVSSATSRPLPLLSRARFDEEEEETCDVSCWVRWFCFSFCLAALTRALERRTLGSEDPG